MCHIIFDYKYNCKNIVEKAFSYIFIGFIPNLGFEGWTLLLKSPLHTAPE